MSDSEKNTLKSEINREQLDTAIRSVKLDNLDFSIQYTILKGSFSFTYINPINNYLNIIVANNYGRVSYSLLGIESLLQKGENWLNHLKKGDEIQVESVGENNVVIIVLISEKRLSAFNSQYQHNLFFVNGFLTKSDNRIDLIITRIIELNDSNNVLSKLKMKTLLMELLIHQIELWYVEYENNKIVINTDQYYKVELVKKIIDGDLSRSFTISELAKIGGTNEQYLKKYFKKYFGRTIMNYITEARMQYARELIHTGKYNVSDVALLTGYKHPSHFTSVFKKHFGFKPTSLRYRAHNNPHMKKSKIVQLIYPLLINPATDIIELFLMKLPSLI